MTIPYEDTPNPQALKFCVSLSPPHAAPRSYRHPDAARDAQDTTALALFGAGPVAGVLILPAFVTVTKTPSARWATLRPKIIAALEQIRNDAI